MINKQTTLDLNGPILSFIQNPTSVTICTTGIATFIGIATATFPIQNPTNPAVTTGYISYQWYDENGALSDDQNVSGSGTTTVTLYNNTKNRQLFLRADYVPSAYGQDPITVGTARSTGNAINDGLDTSIAILNLYPTISIKTQPSDSTVAQNAVSTFTTEAVATDNSNVFYQWQLNGNDLSDSSFNGNSLSSSSTILTIIDDLGTSERVDFSKLSTYSNFVSGRTYTITSNSNITTKIYAVGGGGGTDSYRGSKGGAGGASQGTFTFISGQSYRLIVGGGAKGATGGFGGGGNGSTGGAGGVSGGGGGYTGLFLNSISQSNSILIAGGGGGGANDPAPGGVGGGLIGGDGDNAGQGRGGTGGTQSAGGTGGSSGSALKGGSGSAAGGGGGYYGGGGGIYYSGCCADGAGGGGSGYLHPTLISNGSFDATNSAGGGNSDTDGSFKIDLVSVQKVATITASGTKTSKLTISSDTVGLNQIRCKITHPTSCNSPIYTNAVNFTVVSARQIINIELLPGAGGSATLYSWDLFNQGSFTLTSSQLPSGNSMCFYAPEKDIDVFIDMYANAGANNGGYNGGQGGVSTIQLTLKQNQEYQIMSLSQTNNGSSIFIYNKSRLIAVAGGGGNAGSNGNGGDGGGVNVAGGNGSGRGAGTGGQLYLPGTLPSTGIFGSSVNNSSILKSGDGQASAPNGGRVLPCPRGDYWYNLGYSACQDMGNVQFYTQSSGVISNSTSSITRGFKAGYGIRNTAGAGTNGGGQGGNGATGGNGGDSGGGGGGGSGYSDGSITIVSTQQGGNTGAGRVVIRSAN